MDTKAQAQWLAFEINACSAAIDACDHVITMKEDHDNGYVAATRIQLRSLKNRLRWAIDELQSVLAGM